MRLFPYTMSCFLSASFLEIRRFLWECNPSPREPSGTLPASIPGHAGAGAGSCQKPHHPGCSSPPAHHPRARCRSWCQRPASSEDVEGGCLCTAGPALRAGVRQRHRRRKQRENKASADQHFSGTSSWAAGVCGPGSSWNSDLSCYSVPLDGFSSMAYSKHFLNPWKLLASRTSCSREFLTSATKRMKNQFLWPQLASCRILQ